MEPMTPREIAYYKAKYRFQWWWYDGGAGQTAENVFSVVCIGVFVYSMWFAAYLLEP